MKKAHSYTVNFRGAFPYSFAATSNDEPSGMIAELDTRHRISSETLYGSMKIHAEIKIQRWIFQYSSLENRKIRCLIPVFGVKVGEEGDLIILNIHCSITISMESPRRDLFDKRIIFYWLTFKNLITLLVIYTYPK